MADTKIANNTFSSSMEGASNYNHWLVETFRPYIGQAVLEIGIGHGGFFDLMPPLRTYVGLDLDGDLVEHARSRYPRLHFVQADIVDPGLPARLAEFDLDTVFCANVLEHVPDHRRAVENMLRLLRPEGHLLLFVPAFQHLYTDLDRLAGHVRRYTRDDLAALMPPGVRIRRLHYFNPIGGLGWWLNGLLSHDSLETKQVTGQVAFFDKYVLPVSRLLTPIAGRVFGQSLVCVVQKSPAALGGPATPGEGQP